MEPSKVSAPPVAAPMAKRINDVELTSELIGMSANPVGLAANKGTCGKRKAKAVVDRKTKNGSAPLPKYSVWAPMASEPAMDPMSNVAAVLPTSKRLVPSIPPWLATRRSGSQRPKA